MLTKINSLSLRYKTRRPLSAKIALRLNRIKKATSPIAIKKNGQTVAMLISESNWRAIQETLYLLSIEGMRESIRAGLQTPLSECSTEVGW